MERIEAIIFDWIGTLSAGSKGGVYPYSEKVLKYLKPKYKIGLVSLAGFGIKKRREDIIKSGLFKYFDSIIISTLKTPEIYIRCMGELGTVPGATAIIDDRTVKGIKIGNNLGLQTFWVRDSIFDPSPPNKKTGNPTYTIKSVEDLLKIL